MTDVSRLYYELASARVAERIAEADRARSAALAAGSRRPHGRHAVARGLHRLADRLET
jgi:hypothetical protein